MNKKKLIKRFFVAVLIIAVGIALFAGYQIMKIRASQPQMHADPVFETEPPVFELPQRDFSVLVFSKTNGFRHHDAIPVANKLLQTFADQQQWAIAYTENGAVFNQQQLAQFDVVVWNNASGPTLTVEQQQAFQNYILGGGGYLGIHAAGDNSHHDWRWYADEVVRSKFTMHPMWPHIQEATLNVDKTQHPVTNGLPIQWSMADEWYSFESSVRSTGSNVLLSIDEQTYDTNDGGMGDDHPMVWSHELGDGRVVYSALGHTVDSYSDKNYQALLLAALSWVGKRNNDK